MTSEERESEKKTTCLRLLIWKNLIEPNFHLAKAYLQNSEASALAFGLVSSRLGGEKKKTWVKISTLHENTREAERKVGHAVHHRTYRWMEPVLCAFALSVQLVCMRCFFYSEPHFLNISLPVRRLNLDGWIRDVTWPVMAADLKPARLPF